MKKLLLISIITLFSSLTFAQLKVEDHGNQNFDPNQLNNGQLQQLATQLQSAQGQNPNGQSQQVNEAQLKQVLQDLKAAQKKMEERNKALEELYNEL